MAIVYGRHAKVLVSAPVSRQVAFVALANCPAIVGRIDVYVHNKDTHVKTDISTSTVSYPTTCSAIRMERTRCPLTKEETARRSELCRATLLAVVGTLATTRTTTVVVSTVGTLASVRYSHTADFERTHVRVFPTGAPTGFVQAARMATVASDTSV